jgi:rhodanese-related sulfurtransferase
MFGFLFRSKIRRALLEGAVIVDVRPAYAFDQQGRVPGSINIPLDRIPINIGRLKSIKRPIVICCQYGNDCLEAARILREEGINDVINGGNWQSLLRKIP